MKEYQSRQYFRASELAEFLPVTEYTIRQWVKDNRIKADLLVGTRMYFLKETIESLIKVTK